MFNGQSDKKKSFFFFTLKEEEGSIYPYRWGLECMWCVWIYIGFGLIF
jgi:hypothetical protein